MLFAARVLVMGFLLAPCMIGQSFPPYGQYPLGPGVGRGVGPGATPVAPGVYFAQAAGPSDSYLGVGLLELDAKRVAELGIDSPDGVEISSVAKDSPADRAGLERGDVILEFRGERVVGVDHFIRLVRETPVGREADVVLWRNGQRTKLAVTVGKRKLAEARIYGLRLDCEEGEDCHSPAYDFTWRGRFPDFDVPHPRMVYRSPVVGAEMEGLDGQLAEFFGVEEGVLVRQVDADSPAGRAGLQAGDVIVSVGGEAAKTPRQVSRTVRRAEPDQPVALEIMRNRTKKTLQLHPDQRGSYRTTPHRGRHVSTPPGEKL
jgi:serine protease Do